MGELYLVEMDRWFTDDGIPVRYFDDDWKYRGRSGGVGYEPTRPWCVMWHHTASHTGTDPWDDANYMVNISADAPIANVMVDREGDAWPLAGGPTNTNGKGRSRVFSKGTVPDNSMNSYAVGIEICNNGVGEEYPAVQMETAFDVSLCLMRHLSLVPDDCCTHQDYAPDRKVDPATAAAVMGLWTPGSINSSGTWNVNDLRAEHQRRWSGDEGEDDEMTDADFERIRQIVQDELNKGTGEGQQDWPGTSRAVLKKLEDTYNEVRVVQEQLK